MKRKNNPVEKASNLQEPAFKAPAATADDFPYIVWEYCQYANGRYFPNVTAVDLCRSKEEAEQVAKNRLEEFVENGYNISGNRVWLDNEEDWTEIVIEKTRREERDHV